MTVLVGKTAPDFTAQAVFHNNRIEPLSLHHYLNGKYGILFFYPLNFTFVCPSEIIAFSNKINEFKNRDAEVIGISIDSQYSHLAWKNTPIEKGGVGDISFPLVADINQRITNSYGILKADAGVALRASFLIDKDKLVRHQVINDLPLGRNVDEMIRMLDALQHYEKHGEVCPANWSQGKDAMQPTSEGVASYLGKNASSL